MTDVERLADLLKAPRDPEDMTVDLMLRIIGAETQRLYLDKWNAITKNGKTEFATPVSHALLSAVLSGVGLMFAIRRLRDVNPQAAEEFVKQYWLMCDSGDSFGEYLWEWTEAAGLDPELIKATNEPTSVVNP